MPPLLVVLEIRCPNKLLNSEPPYPRNSQLIMLYYTFADGSTKGIFSGRFTFKVHSPEDGNVAELIDSIERSAGKYYGQTLNHERMHHRLSCNAPLGIQLVGLRFIARLAFAIGNHRLVSSYYEKRTRYFALSYRLHERLVDRLLRQQSNSYDSEKVGELYIRAVRKLDERIAGGKCQIMAIRLGLSYSLGKLATREFGVILSDHSNPEGPKLREATSRNGQAGVFNAAFQPSKRDGLLIRIVKAARRAMNIEGLSRFLGREFNGDRILLWTILKLQSEYLAMRKLFELPSSASLRNRRIARQAIMGSSTPEEYFDRYLTVILPFALKYQGIPPISVVDDIFSLKSALKRAVREEDFSALTDTHRKHLSLAGGLFFYHGN